MMTQGSKMRRVEELRGNTVSSVLTVEDRGQKSFLNLLLTPTNTTTLQTPPRVVGSLLERELHTAGRSARPEGVAARLA